MDHPLDTSRTGSPSNPADQPLRQTLERLEADLAGFPVSQLLEVFMSAQQSDRADAHRLVDRCLMNWIESLELALDDYPQDPDDALERVQARQRGTRDALLALKKALAQA